MERPPAAGEAAACIMSEVDWLTSVVGSMSDAEIREFKLPALSRVHENDPADGRPWTLVKVQALASRRCYVSTYVPWCRFSTCMQGL